MRNLKITGRKEISLIYQRGGRVMSRKYYIYECMECGKEVAGLSMKLDGTRCDCGGSRLPREEIKKELVDKFNEGEGETIEG